MSHRQQAQPSKRKKLRLEAAQPQSDAAQAARAAAGPVRGHAAALGWVVGVPVTSALADELDAPY